MGLLVVAGRARITVAMLSLAIYQVHVLLHLELSLLLHLAELARNVSHALLVRLLLLALLLLRLVGHANVAVFFNESRQFFIVGAHLAHVLVNLVAKLIAIAFRAYLFLHRP